MYKDVLVLAIIQMVHIKHVTIKGFKVVFISGWTANFVYFVFHRGHNFIGYYAISKYY